jgi:hypothetical protein
VTLASNDGDRAANANDYATATFHRDAQANDCANAIRVRLRDDAGAASEIWKREEES